MTEGPFDADVRRRMLPQELLEGVEFVVAGGVSAAKSLARSLLVRRQTPVAIAIDADAVSPEVVQERRQSVEEVVESVAGNVPGKVIVAVPHLEAILYQDPALLENVFGQAIPDSLRTLASTYPGHTLEQLHAQSPHIPNREQLLSSLTPFHCADPAAGGTYSRIGWVSPPHTGARNSGTVKVLFCKK